MTNLFDRLQTAVGDSYRLERELGGGGMSRVFVAEETALGRKVVIKLLPPEMGAGVNVDRFQREIKLSASLQHPHIVPLLTAGSKGDLLYYVMPFIEGESLRTKLAREGELPIPDAVRVLKEVADALSYAHSHRVVHRDIKPDNVLLSGRHAVVTDFGVAKAVSASTDDSSLTSLGVALGTPAYMAPEQASADPHVDHRADIYALGAMAYEMLCGRPPFTGPSPQAVLGAHVTQSPEPATSHRSAVPEALNQLVMRCLEKKAADRWQRADELIPHLDSILTPSGGMTPTGTRPVEAVSVSQATRAARNAHPVRVAALFGGAAALILIVVYALMITLGLPDWVFVGAIALLAVGLPITLMTSHQERKRAVATVTGMRAAPATGVEQHFTWRKALLGGGIAFAGLALVTGGYTGMRLMGIGPVGTLQASGVLDEDERIILADFQNATDDSTLAETVTELFRIALGDSRAITIVSEAQVARVIERMERDPNAVLTAEVASEVAIREGIKAFLSGEVRSLGETYVVSARLVSAESREELLSAREQVGSSEELIGAVEQISTMFRERIGESLRTIRADPPLAQLTTGSLEALRLYAQATRTYNLGQTDRAISLLEQTVAVDSNFAGAWRRLGAYLGNPGVGRAADGRQALQRAYALRDRLSDRERQHVEAIYAIRVERDYDRAVTVYLSLLDQFPDDATALNNIAVAYTSLGNRVEAERWYREAIKREEAGRLAFTSLVSNQWSQGKFAAADSTLTAFVQEFPDHPDGFGYAAGMASARGEYDEALSILDDFLAKHGSLPNRESNIDQMRAAIAATRGRLRESAEWQRRRRFVDTERRGLMTHERRAVVDQVDAINLASWFGVSRIPADSVERLWDRTRELSADDPEASLPWNDWIRYNVQIGSTDRAATLLNEYRAVLSEDQVENRRIELMRLDAEVALAAGKVGDAVREFRAARDEATALGTDRALAWWLGAAYRALGNADSALTYYQLYLDSPILFQIFQDSRLLAPAILSLGELHEQRGDNVEAVNYYSRFVDLWADADAELQPQVVEIRERIARLVGEKR